MQINYCPRCGKKLENQIVAYRERLVCLKTEAAGCGFVDFGRYSLGAGGVALISRPDGETGVLLIQRGEEPNKGGWTIPGGFVEFDETADVAVVREIKEETGLDCTVLGLIGYRNRADPGDNTSYVVFLLEVTGGSLVTEPSEEIAQAGFYTIAEMEQIERLAPLSFELAKAAILGDITLLTPVQVRGIFGRPPFTLFK
jgi:ADP-ribose pyrophosphatase YjhB (NUDIX family)